MNYDCVFEIFLVDFGAEEGAVGGGEGAEGGLLDEACFVEVGGWRGWGKGGRGGRGGGDEGCEFGVGVAEGDGVGGKAAAGGGDGEGHGEGLTGEGLTGEVHLLTKTSDE